jgi:hypothetical protein
LLKLSHGPTGTFHWPGFRHIHTEDLFVHHDECRLSYVYMRKR